MLGQVVALLLQQKQLEEGVDRIDHAARLLIEAADIILILPQSLTNLGRSGVGPEIHRCDGGHPPVAQQQAVPCAAQGDHVHLPAVQQLSAHRDHVLIHILRVMDAYILIISGIGPHLNLKALLRGVVQHRLGRGCTGLQHQNFHLSATSPHFAGFC